MKSILTLLLPLFLAGLVSASEAVPTFTKKPTAVKAGGKVKIEFMVDRATDVAVVLSTRKVRINFLNCHGHLAVFGH